MRIIKIIKKDTVFLISMLLAIASTIILRPAGFDIDYKVIVVLFDLMLIIAMFDTFGLLEFIALRSLILFNSYRGISIAMTALCFVSSMFITNDIALITIVPITISIAKAIDIDPLDLIIVETIAANIGSSFSPIGNPQNIFLFFHYSLNLWDFSLIMAPVCLIGMIMIITSLIGKVSIDTTYLTRSTELKPNKRLFSIILLFVITLFIINTSLSIILFSLFLIGVVYIIDKQSLLKVDYYLLGTFLWLFVFISNIKASGISTHITIFMSSPKSTLITSILFSQFISNVPASLLLANFTENYKALILGVNIGGLGTIVASLASLISYRFYVSYKPDNKNMYLKQFHIVNFKYLVLLSLFALIVL